MYRGWISCYDPGRECKPAKSCGDVPGISTDPFCREALRGKSHRLSQQRGNQQRTEGIETGKDFYQGMKYQPS